MKEIKVHIMPGAFDEFEGTQEELNEFLAELKNAVQDGSFFKDARPLTDEEVEELAAKLNPPPRQ